LLFGLLPGKVDLPVSPILHVQQGHRSLEVSGHLFQVPEGMLGRLGEIGRKQNMLEEPLADRKAAGCTFANKLYAGQQHRFVCRL
jgi:hypothetical protein